MGPKSSTNGNNNKQFGSWYYDVKNKKTTWSKETISIFGFDEKDLPDYRDYLYQLYLSVVHPDDLKRVQETIEASRAADNSYHIEHKILTSDNEIKYVTVTANEVYDENGDVIFIHGTVIDNTRTMEMEQLALDTEKKLIEAQRVGGLGNWTWNVNSNEVFWSDQTYEIYGLDKKEFEPSYDNFRMLLHPNDTDKVDEATRLTLEEDQKLAVEHRLKLLDGSIKYVIQQGEVIKDSDGNPIMMTGTVLDITDLKIAQHAAQTSETRLLDIFNIAPAAIITFDHKQRIQKFNRAAQKIFGYKEDEVFGKHMDILIPDEYRENHATLVQNFDDSGSQHVDMEDRQGILGLKKDGSQFPASASVSTFGSDEEKVYTLVLVDTTQRQIIEEEKTLALTRAQEANKAKSRFLATMSHELRTPLNAIIGFSEMMHRGVFGPLGNDKYEGYVRDIVNSSQHLLTLVNDILDLSEIESGHSELAPQHIDLNDIVDESFYYVRKMAEDKGISCETIVPANIEKIFADKRGLIQVLINILTNSVKYTDRNGKISLKASMDDNHHFIIIEDTGKGIPEDKIETITSPFNRVNSDPYLTEEGTGLGLTIVKSLMNLHHGKLIIESTVGVGTTVKLLFPRVIEEIKTEV